MKYKSATLKLCGLVAAGFVFAVAAQLTASPDDTHDDTARTVCARVILDSVPGGVQYVNKLQWPVTRTGFVWRVTVVYQTTHGQFITTQHRRACQATQLPSGRWSVEMQP